MSYVIVAILFTLFGIKYGELRDVMMARRISRLLNSSRKLSGEQQDYDALIAAEQRIKDEKVRCNYCTGKFDKSELKMGLCVKCQERGE